MLANISVCLYKDEVEAYAIEKSKGNKINIVFIGDCNDTEYIKSLGASAAPLFNPSLESVQCLLDGNLEGFNMYYLNYLDTSLDVDEYILMMIKSSVIYGIPVILYINHDESELYLDTFLNFLRNKYGLTVAIPYSNMLNMPMQGFIDDNAFQNIIENMYMRNMINANEFIRCNRKDFNYMNPDICNKYMIETNQYQQIQQQPVYPQVVQTQEPVNNNQGGPLIYDNI